MLAVIPIVDALVSLDFRIFANKKTPLNLFQRQDCRRLYNLPNIFLINSPFLYVHNKSIKIRHLRIDCEARYLPKDAA